MKKQNIATFLFILSFFTISIMTILFLNQDATGEVLIQVDTNNDTSFHSTVDSAIDACPNEFSSWCKITIPAGNYTLSRKTTIGDTSGVFIAKNNLMLVGEDVGKTVLKTNGSNLIVIWKNNNVTISDLSLDAQKTPDNKNKPIAIFNSTNILINNVEVYNGDAGIAIMTATSQRGNSALITIQNSKIHDNKVGGIHIDTNQKYTQTHHDIIIKNNEIWNSGTKGIHIGATYCDKIIENNIHDNLIGIAIDGANPMHNDLPFFIEIRDNKIHDNYANGVRIANETGLLTIVSNEIYNNNVNKTTTPYHANHNPAIYFKTFDTLAPKYIFIGNNNIFDNQTFPTQFEGIAIGADAEFLRFRNNSIAIPSPLLDSHHYHWRFLQGPLINSNNTFFSNMPQPNLVNAIS